MPAALMDFQNDVCAGIVARFASLRAIYDALRNHDASELAAARRRDGAVVLQAPTGAGKTLIAVEALARVSKSERVLWFWFAPFAGLIEQSRKVLTAQAPELRLLDLENDRSVETVAAGGVFVTTWASVAARSAHTRRARTTGDAGLALDALIALARESGLRIGCVVDEAHHGFHKAAEARRFFAEVLKPDYTLMMTATPRDRDAAAFAADTGWRVGEPADWASVSRLHAVQAGLLKRGVRMVRFLARDKDTAQLVDFEHLALAECTAMHRRIKQALAAAGAALTPLMLVQVPDGKDAQKAAQRHLIEVLKFPESAVRVHTADEPDPDLIALANDPGVEVLIFKMAVALGFDAPRAFTLAALRGARDPAFGVQVIGRIVRVHALLRGRENLPDALDHGYVFLANSQSQEGLLDAGQQINALTTRAPELGTQTVLTVIGDRRVVQVVRSGEPLGLLVTAEGAQSEGGDVVAALAGDEPMVGEADERQPWVAAAQELLALSGGEDAAVGRAPSDAAIAAPLLVLTSKSIHRYPRRADAPAQLRGERLPPAPADMEARLVDFVDFSHAVLGDRDRSRVKVQKDQTDLFAGASIHEGADDVWANLSPEAVAEKAGQIRLRLSESNDRELQLRLLDRFRRAIEQSGAPPPEDEELLVQQLDLVLVRNPALLREAYKRYRGAQVVDVGVPLLAELHSDVRLPPARRALYGVLPADLNEDETAIALTLDASPLVRWWHRNPVRRDDAVGLYRWDDGDGFFPDFVVALDGRDKPDGIALLEVKGNHLWGLPSEIDKAGARHAEYGDVFMVGRPRGASEFVYLRELGGKLDNGGGFDVARMRW
ncbi:MAG: DEAD/DEAH box helicase family protein [Proteobacteria bacterium]|nr:DEAD/DEAH box helicase family protein [Pseudomonadota bacterium]